MLGPWMQYPSTQTTCYVYYSRNQKSTSDVETALAKFLERILPWTLCRPPILHTDLTTFLFYMSFLFPLNLKLFQVGSGGPLVSAVKMTRSPTPVLIILQQKLLTKTLNYLSSSFPSWRNSYSRTAVAIAPTSRSWLD